MSTGKYMYTLHHQKQKQKTSRSPGTMIYKGCLGLIIFKKDYRNQNKSKNGIGLNIDKRK